MQRICRQMFAVVVVVVALAGTASAQSPAPNTFPAIPISPSPVYVPVPAVMPGANVRQTSGGFNGPVEIRGMGPCEAVRAIVNQPPVAYGNYDSGSNGAGNYKSDLGFMYGSSKSFFDPCGPIPCNGPTLGGRLFGGHHCTSCGAKPFGAPYNTGCSTCKYGSYLDR
jgi:hypothetical protein